jgi:hypothetical protein
MDIASPDPTIKPTTIVSPTKIENTVEETTLNGEELLKRRCTECHGLNYITTESMDAEGWTSTVQRMLDKGAYLSEAEQKVLIEYLATTYP